MSFTRDVLSIICLLEKPMSGCPGEKVVFEYCKNKRIKMVQFPSKEWELMDAPEAKARIAAFEAEGWVESEYNYETLHRPASWKPKDIWISRADYLAALPNVTRQELLND